MEEGGWGVIFRAAGFDGAAGGVLGGEEVGVVGEGAGQGGGFGDGGEGAGAAAGRGAGGVVARLLGAGVAGPWGRGTGGAGAAESAAGFGALGGDRGCEEFDDAVAAGRDCRYGALGTVPVLVLRSLVEVEGLRLVVQVEVRDADVGSSGS